MMCFFVCFLLFFFFKQETAYDIRISYWSSDVCSSDLVRHYYFYLSALDQTVYGGLVVLEYNILESVSQELRLASDFDGPLNFFLGGYYQHSKDDLYNNALITPYVFYGLAGNGRYDAYEKVADLVSDTISVFGQMSFDIADNLELAGGLRYTHEKRTTTNRNRSEEHTSELQSLMRISYAVFCLKK